MAKVTYVGPHDAVDVAVDGIDYGTCVREQAIDVPDEVAVRLLEQETWKRAPAPKAKEVKT